jgi:3-methyladenine DNA glycosylase AlkD
LETPAYIQPIKDAFEVISNQENAKQMRKYMKEKFAFFGINTPKRKEIYKEHKNKYGLIPDSEKYDVVNWCLAAPQREFQYFAMELLGKRQKDVEPKIIDLYEYMIITKSWWDTVDFIAANLVGSYFKQYPENTNQMTAKWMHSDNIWLQRSCLLFQLKYKTNTDAKLLVSFIQPLLSSKEFFIRKAIGWALREYSKTNADFVIQFAK